MANCIPLTYTSDKPIGPQQSLSTERLTHAHARIQGVGQGVRIPVKNHKNIGFSRNSGPDPLENDYATKPATKINHRLASETPFKWRFVGEPMMARL